MSCKRKIILLSLFLCQLGARAQQLSIGKKLPSMLLQSCLGSEVVDLNNFKGKVIVLDFWSTGCLSCIQSFPRLDTLQQKYGDRVQIVLVNFEPRKTTQSFFASHKKIKLPRNIPMVNANDFLTDHFKRPEFPYAAWIDKEGIVRYFTSGHNTTDQNLSAFLNGKRLSVDTIDLKRDVRGPVFMAQSENLEGRFLFYTYITHWVKGVNVGYDQMRLTNEGRSLRLSSNCSSILDLAKMAFEEKGRHFFNWPYTIKLEVIDTSRFMTPADMSNYDSWKIANAYNYDLVMPVNRRELMYPTMQEDLKRFFGVDIYIEKRKVPCLALVRLKETCPYHNPAIQQGDSMVYLRSVSPKLLCSRISEWDGFFPVIDETNSEEKMDIMISSTAIENFNLEELRKNLQRCGLDLLQTERELDVLVIKERKENSGALFSFSK